MPPAKNEYDEILRNNRAERDEVLNRHQSELGKLIARPSRIPTQSELEKITKKHQDEFEEIAKRHTSEFDARARALQDNIDSLENKIQEQRPVEITSMIERLELIEEKLGVRFDGVYGVCVKRTFESPEDFLIEVNFDVVGTEETLKRSFSPTLSAYNSAGQLLNTETSFIHDEKFLGIQSIKIQMLCVEHPIRLRLYPAKPI